jgi:hypothetical protein
MYVSRTQEQNHEKHARSLAANQKKMLYYAYATHVKRHLNPKRKRDTAGQSEPAQTAL